MYTGLCRQQQKRIEAAIEKAWDHGKWQSDSGTANLAVQAVQDLLLYYVACVGLIPFTVPRQMPEDHLRTPPWNKIDVR